MDAVLVEKIRNNCKVVSVAGSVGFVAGAKKGGVDLQIPFANGEGY
jgi:catalase (peroxidase I)